MPNSDFNLKRNEILAQGYKRIGVLRPGTRILSAAQLQDGVQVLNLILREIDAKGTKNSKHLWALAEKHLFLKVEGIVYNSDDGLAQNILDLQTVFYNNGTGAETAVELVTANSFESISDKTDTGYPTKAYLKYDKDLQCQLLYLWPHLTSVTTPSEVTGTDGLNYKCVSSHTSTSETRPISGQSYRIYWEQVGSSGSAWVTDTAYTGGEGVRYMFKRPLYDFDNASDNPDFPAQWTRYLWLRLAYDLSGHYHISEEERRSIKGDYLEAEMDIFPGTQPAENSHWNKSLYF